MTETLANLNVLSQNNASSEFFANGGNFGGNWSRTSKTKMDASRKFEGLKRAAEPEISGADLSNSNIIDCDMYQFFLKVK